MIIKINTNLKDTQFANKEHRHLTLLLFMQKAQSFLIEAKELLGDEDWYTKLEKIYYDLPDEVIELCGYKKNYNSFNQITQIIVHTLKNEVLQIARETLFEDLPNIKELEFLKVNN